MTQYQSRVCSLIIEESFGELTEKVASHLMKHGSQKLSDIIKTLKIKKAEAVKSLCVLIQHQLVSYSPHKSGCMVYHVNVPAVLGRVHYPMYVLTAKDLVGDIGELIVEDLILHGQSSMSQCLLRVVKGLNKDVDKKLLEDAKKQFISLVEYHILQRVTSPTEELGVTAVCHFVPSSERYLVPHINMSHIVGQKRSRVSDEEEDTEQPATKRKKSENTSKIDNSDDADILWFINTEQYRRHYRSQAIIDAVTERLDPMAATLMRIIVNLSDKGTHIEEPLYSAISSEIFLPQIRDSLSPNISLQDDEVEQYMSVLVDEKFLQKLGDAGGGSYCINYKNISELLCQATLESVVRERFGSKHLRLFRLLLLKKHLEQKQISDMALIPNKETKEMLYSLLAEQFVSLQEIPRSTDYAPSRTFYLFTVHLQQVARLVLQRCYKTLGNLMMRRKHELSENKRLLDKYVLWERQQELQTELGEEIEEALTPSEREKAEKIKLTIAKLEQGELQLDTSIACLEDYLGFLTHKK